MVDNYRRMILNVWVKLIEVQHNSESSPRRKTMKRLGILFVLVSLFALVLAPQAGFAIGRKPKQKTSYEYPTIKPIQNKPNAQDMQIATGEIPPINEEEKR